jgi:Uma2 family endonuclease
VAEVLSPGTRARDQTVKLVEYFAVPSVLHYLLVETRRRLIVHHRRGAADEIVTRFVPSGRLRLDPPGLGLDVALVYAGTDVA